MSDIQITYFEELKRKLIHLSSLWMVFAVVLIPNRWITAGLFAFLLAGTLLWEHAYACRRPVLTPLYGFFFGRMLRKEPEPGAWIVSGGSYVLMAALLVTVLYAPLAAGGALGGHADRGCGGGTDRAPVRTPPGAEPTKAGREWRRSCWSAAACWRFTLRLSERRRDCSLPERRRSFPACAAELFEKQLHIDDNFSIPVIIGFGLQLGLWTQNA